MAEEGARPRLGRGLAALIGDFGDTGQTPPKAEGQRKVPVEFLRPNPRNPRRSFGDAELAELAVSINQRGIIQPIVVRPIPEVPGTYEIVAGERRWRAAQRAELEEVPVVVVEIDDRASLEFAILENVQRSDLNPIEEASGYERLMQDFSYTQKELAEILGKSRSHLANTLRLLNLPPSVQDRVSAGELTAGHARALLPVRDPEALARRVVAEGLSVREVEALASAEAEPAETPRAGRPRLSAERSAPVRDLELRIHRALGVPVSYRPKDGDSGEIRIRYESQDELQGLLNRFRVSDG
ncbi:MULTISPECIES: ParB/RepB/Spo0J family partition protein [Methylobacterium]|uniref:ParB/RepB/Spo0J family partition protein n=1 Tax=Methylobacterium longum TaxID=767694 RepID=A0ABT8AND9_9HYPH|nr:MULTISPECIES: ParB/RepB/Spo0J family partition protein [Methylobacterium]MCJ2100000.1 ParB/RepB/Spo0J family partition protein [Methylobacterium sp. E-046]MDN3570950.1 ParB/RepB/Spo0J family partition protein [Methylobacterium longum]GJE12020.1 Chromosome-partitioning protein ParB [Methylobacterium longum]